jgi:hypothetical protein
MKILPGTVIARTGEVIVISRVGFALMAVVLLGILLVAPTPAYAQWCSSNADCGGGDTCVVTWNFLFKIGRCHVTGCNENRDCPNGSMCDTGTCQPPAPVPGTEHHTHGHIPGEGRKCYPANGSRPADWATDTRGKPLPACLPGLVCSDWGYCIKRVQ